MEGGVGEVRGSKLDVRDVKDVREDQIGGRGRKYVNLDICEKYINPFSEILL